MNTVKRETILSWIEKIALIVILYKMITLIIGGGEQFYETHINRFVWEGLIYLGIAILIVFRLNLKNIFIYIPTIVFIAVWYVWLVKTDYKVNSPDLWMLYIRKGLALATLMPLVVDALFKKKFAQFKELNLVKIILFGLTCIGVMLVPNSMGGIHFLAIFLVYSLISFEKARIEMFLLCFTVSDVMAVAVLSVKSLITHPYVGEPRYYGAFTNLHGFGMFVGSGIACCFFLYVYGLAQKWNKYVLIFTITPFMLFELYVFGLINSRNAMLGVIVAFVAACWLLSAVVGRRKLFAKVICIMAILGLLAVGMIVFWGLNFDKYSDFLRKVPQLDYLVQSYGRLDKPMLSETDIFPVDSVWNRIDYLSNQRVSAWKVTIEQLKWFSGNSSLIVVTEEWSTNTHNTYLGYLNGYGIVVGALLIITLIYTLISAIGKAKTNCKESTQFGCLELVIVIWYAYAFTIFINEMQYLTGFYILMSLLLMSFLPKMKKREMSNGVED